MRPLARIVPVIVSMGLCACASVHFEGVDTDQDQEPSSDIGRQVLPANDGWAAAQGAVTGGSKAAQANDYTVTNRKELFEAATKGGDEPRIIRVKGTINLSTDDSGRELLAADYAAPGYDFTKYAMAYAPSVWSTKLTSKGRPERKLTGPLEEARKASVKRQRAQITLKLKSNTTLVGIGSDAKLVRGNVWIGPEAENVIIRNIAFEDAFDYFPEWDPGDSYKVRKEYPGCQTEYVDAKTGPQMCPGGRWNSEYDNISVNGGKRVWIDHCSFSDGSRPDSLYPPIFPFPQNEITQKVQHHDGSVDITNAADFVTLSYNVFHDHDKTNLIGGSDSSKIDSGHLNVTFHHNLFENVGQRMPRVRFGKVHAYNNAYLGDALGNDDPSRNAYENHLAAIEAHKINKGSIFRVALGAGKESSIYSEGNVFVIKNGGQANAVANMGGSNFFDQGSLVNGQPLDVSKAGGKPLKTESDWKPTLYGGNTVMPASEVLDYLREQTGPGKI